MPTASDLVTDLPADFETFGQAVATSMADLLGGTTGQVLSKASNTNMDFTWVTSDDANAIQNAIVDAKGDLIGATAADTPARLAVGTNGQVLTADSTTATGLAWATPAGSSGPAFRAFRNTTDQTFSASTWTKIQFNAETFDTDNCFDSTTNYRFLPTKAGYYQINFGATFSGTNATTNKFLSIVKNGGFYANVFSSAGSGTPGAGAAAAGSDLVYCNGTTDYVEGYIYDTDAASRSAVAGTQYTWISGTWIRS
jgi:hypothetical protein